METNTTTRGRAGTAWRAWTWLLLAAALALPATAAAITRVDDGDPVALRPDEGLLVLSIDTDINIDRVQFRDVARRFTSGTSINRPRKGQTFRLFRVRAGEYQWSRATLLDLYSYRSWVDFTGNAEFRFKVEAGRINYPGDLILRTNEVGRVGTHLANRSLPVLDWLRGAHPQAWASLPFAYAGEYPDPFPEAYRKATASLAAAPPADPVRAPPAMSPLPVAPVDLFAEAHVSDAEISPDGRLSAMVVLERGKDGANDRYALELVDVAAGLRQRIGLSEPGFSNLRWKDDGMLLASVPQGRGFRLHAFQVGPAVDGKRAVRAMPGPYGGALVSLLPHRPGRILYESWAGDGELGVHELEIGGDGFDDPGRRAGYRRLNRGDGEEVEDAVSWFADGDGRLRAAIAVKENGEGDEDDTVVLMHRGRTGDYREVLRLDADDGFQPLYLSRDGSLLYALTDTDRAQRDLVVFDPAQGRVTTTLFSRPGVDVAGTVQGADGAPAAVVFYRDGRRVTEFFDPAAQALASRLDAAFPGRSVALASRSTDGRRMLLWVDGSDQPLQLYHLDLDTRKAQVLEDDHPQLVGKAFVPSQLLRVERAGLPPLDAFLTLPKASGPRPVVVMAHGGPVGVADSLHFDPEVQLLASMGIGVLQVNFRGSDGYGRAFRESAIGQYGTGIEDDIDAALQLALARHPLDGGRMCALGTSYGGYSALVSAMRWQQRFRCVVSVAGISDRQLFFTASDGARSVRGREQLLKYVGDPVRDAEAMVATSPLYHVDRLQVPVMLVHGREDVRVDFEHSRRLSRMLTLAGRTPVMVALDDTGHGFGDVEKRVQAWTGIAGFLQQHLLAK